MIKVLIKKVTVVNEDGVRMIDLNMDGKSSLDLAVLMSHEAFRDGKDGGEFGQKRETFQAVEGHMNVSSALQSDYGASYLNKSNNQEAFIYKQYLAGNISRTDLVRYAENSYDGTKDYWKLMEDGSLAYDGDGWLKDSNDNYILDENGEKIGEGGVQSGLQKILGITDNAVAVKMLRDAGFELREDGTYWTHDGNAGEAISLGESHEYDDLYDSKLFDKNTLNIYNSLVTSGIMDRNTEYDTLARGAGKTVADATYGSGYIGYEEWKANNFVQGVTAPGVNNILAGSEVTTVLGATGSYSLNPHRGVDFGIPAGTPINSIFTENTIFFDGDNLPNSPSGNYQETRTNVTYLFKGKSHTDTILTRYMHLQSRNPDLVKGQLITNNMELGLSGNTGTWPGV